MPETYTPKDQINTKISDLHQTALEGILPSTDEEIARLLLERARTASQLPGLNTTPENSGVVSFHSIDSDPDDVVSSSPALSVVGEYMPTIDAAEEELEKLKQSELIRKVMENASLSRLTGCIMPDLARNHKGYTKTAIKAVRELGLGNTSRETHRVVHFARFAEETGDLPSEEDLKKEVDHVCRNPSCLYHTRLIDKVKNNELRAEATRIEPEIIAGRMLYITDLLPELPWLSFALAEEGDQPAKVISTRVGPFALWLANPNELVVYGERLGCQAFDDLKALGKKPTSRKSRAKPKTPKPIKNHTVLFPKTKFRRKHLPDAKELYRAQNAA